MVVMGSVRICLFVRVCEGEGCQYLPTSKISKIEEGKYFVNRVVDFL